MTPIRRWSRSRTGAATLTASGLPGDRPTRASETNGFPVRITAWNQLRSLKLPPGGGATVPPTIVPAGSATPATFNTSERASRSSVMWRSSSALSTAPGPASACCNLSRRAYDSTTSSMPRSCSPTNSAVSDGEPDRLLRASSRTASVARFPTR